MLAATAGELRLVLPVWGSALLGLLGLAYLVFGGRWPRVFDVLSLTVIGCGVGLMASPLLPAPQWLVIVAAGIVAGGLGAFFRTVLHAVLAAIVTAGVLAHLAALAVGPDGFASYLFFEKYGRLVPGPNLKCDPVLAAGLVGLVLGATLAVTRFKFSERFLTSAQGAVLLLVAGAEVVSQYYGPERLSLAESYPLTLAAAWVCLVGVGLVAQAALGPRPASGGSQEAPEPLSPRQGRSPKG